MPKKVEKFIVFIPEKNKYLVNEYAGGLERLNKPWNTCMHLTPKKLYATRYGDEISATFSMEEYVSYTKIKRAYSVMRIWE